METLVHNGPLKNVKNQKIYGSKHMATTLVENSAPGPDGVLAIFLKKDKRSHSRGVPFEFNTSCNPRSQNRFIVLPVDGAHEI